MRKHPARFRIDVIARVLLSSIISYRIRLFRYQLNVMDGLACLHHSSQFWRLMLIKVNHAAYRNVRSSVNLSNHSGTPLTLNELGLKRYIISYPGQCDHI